MRSLAFSLLLLLTILPLARAEAAASSCTLQLHSQAQVPARTVTLDAIASIACPDDGRLRALQTLRVASLNQPGQPLRLTPARVRHVIDTALPALRGSYALSGAPTVVVSWNAMPFDTDALLAWSGNALADALRAREPQADLHLVPMARPTVPDALPRGTVSYALRPVSQPLTSRMQAHVDVLVDGRQAATLVAWFRVSGSIPAWRMRSAAAAGTKLHAELLSAERIPIADEPLAMLAPDTVSNFRVRTNKEAGSVLYASELTPKRTIERGEQVAVHIALGAVAVEDRAVALGEGLAGGEIRLLNPRTREIYAATVRPDGTAEVK
ncbi:flagellar basal body P-ring formation chaperone FlgA [Noviherbaspirillum pedocola]|uniref:Flagellar basal body P-ring formation protein FlgA n=1 Tax=Noviherbaspirillum pedocola TaxID=2801341 RepID=A0A934SSB9_9BURK|nr:flagellar basal body P-ring formation chaperone FlgA [Noviherbaspirillum pedocola]MBK4735690.1 flagellar basal body P-ring formation protein FlgA [Noviherbaspirillum pedocola]